MAAYHQGWDYGFDCYYSISVTSTEAIHENDDAASVYQVYINVKYVFKVPPGGKYPIAQTELEELVAYGCQYCWNFNIVDPHGLSGLRREVVRSLDSDSIPSAAKENTVRMIFDDVLGREYLQRARASERQMVSVAVVAEAEYPKSEEEDEDPIEDEGGVRDEEETLGYYEDPNEAENGDGDEEYGRAVEESIEEGFLYVKARPAKREAVEVLERVRVWGEERETGCAVCMDEFSFEIQAMKMPCSHVFHTDCLVTWLERQCFCPLCKFELPSEEAEEEDGYVLNYVDGYYS